MGAIVGGLYAAGMSPVEIEKLFNEIDWLDLFSDRPSEEYMSFRRKKDKEQLMNLELGVQGWRVTLPRGVIPGHLPLDGSKIPSVYLDGRVHDWLSEPWVGDNR